MVRLDVRARLVMAAAPRKMWEEGEVPRTEGGAGQSSLIDW